MLSFIQAAEPFLPLWQPAVTHQAVNSLALVLIFAAVLLLLVLAALAGLLVVRRLQRKAAQPGGKNVPSQTLPRDEIAGWLVLADRRQLSLTRLPVSIGADAANQVTITNPTVAPFHARIYVDDVENVVCIEDPSGGNNLLLVNGKPTRRNLLKNHDEITLGTVTMHYQLPVQPGAPANAVGRKA